MTYAVLFELVPPGVFGVPERGRTVIPAGPGTYTGDAYHSALGVRAAYGTMSRYRDEDEALGVDIDLHHHPARVRDNFLRIEVEAGTHVDAMATARTLAEAFTQQLAVASGRWMSAVPLMIESPDGNDKPAPRFMTLSAVTMYDLRQLADAITLAARASEITDDRLLRGRTYYQHALWLFEQRASLPDPLESNSRMLIASVFLNLWKAASSVVGEPTSDGDYQSRYRQLGFDHQFFQDRIEPIRRLRNDYDVAHYHLDPTALDAVEQRFGEASGTVQLILSRYTDLLLR